MYFFSSAHVQGDEEPAGSAGGSRSGFKASSKRSILEGQGKRPKTYGPTGQRCQPGPRRPPQPQVFVMSPRFNQQVPEKTKNDFKFSPKIPKSALKALSMLARLN